MPRKIVYMDKRLFTLWITFLLILITPLTNAVSMIITPTELDWETEYSGSKTFIISVVNGEPQTLEVTMGFDSGSSYLGEHFTFSPESFMIKANGMRNVEVTSRLPKDFFPGFHSGIIIPSTKLGKGEGINITFSVPGAVVYNMRMLEIEAQNTFSGKPPEIIITAFNKGNSVVRGFPFVRLFRIVGEEEQSMSYFAGALNDPVVLVPGTVESIFFNLSDIPLELGNYKIIASLSFNGQRSEELESIFSVLAPDAGLDLGEHSVKAVFEGQKSSLLLGLENPTSQIMPYRLRIMVEDIDYVVEGSIPAGTSEDVSVEIDSSSLGSGSYPIRVLVYSGPGLGSMAEIDDILHVRSFMLFVITGIAALLVLAVILIFALPKTRRRESKIDELEKTVRGLDSEVHGLVHRVYDFIKDANDWLGERDNDDGFRFK